MDILLNIVDAPILVECMNYEIPVFRIFKNQESPSMLMMNLLLGRNKAKVFVLLKAPDLTHIF